MKVSLHNLGTKTQNRVYLASKDKTLIIWFSYETPVSFKYTDTKDFGACDEYTRQNEWNHITGKFLNELEPDKNLRIPGADFESKLKEALSQL